MILFGAPNEMAGIIIGLGCNRRREGVRGIRNRSNEQRPFKAQRAEKGPRRTQRRSFRLRATITRLHMSSFDTIFDIAQRVRRREISPVEITRECLGRIEKLNPRLNAFITVMRESSLAEAAAAEAEID